MKNWKHINFEQRKTICSCVAHNYKVKDIGELLGLDPTSISKEVLAELLSIDKESWMQEVEDQKSHLDQFEKLPAELKAQYEALASRIAAM